MIEKRKQNPILITSKFRASYEHLLEPWTGDPEKPAKYSVQAIFPKDDPFITKLRKVIRQVAVEEFGNNAPKLMRTGKLKQPIRDGDDEFPGDKTYEGMVFVNLNGSAEGKTPPGLVDQKLRDIRKKENPSETWYSGVYARAEVRVFAYNQRGGKGVSVFITNVQKLGEGDRLGGGKPASEVFDEVEGGDEDVDSVDDWDDESF